MKKWELARYLIDAKKNIDSLMYINDHLDELSNLDIKSKIYSIQTEFYIKLCVIFDDIYDKKKREICKGNAIIEDIYKERDKDKAHKDKNYIKPNYASISEMIDVMKKQILEVKSMCDKNLPDVLTLDFVSHDKELFRFIHGLTKDKEDEIRRQKYITTQKSIDGDIKKVFDDTEDMKNIKEDEKRSYAVLMKDGINIYEGIQERQDACIKINVLFDDNIWIRFDKKSRMKIEELAKNGLIDSYGMPLRIEEMDENKLKMFNRIMKNEGEKNE